MWGLNRLSNIKIKSLNYQGENDVTWKMVTCIRSYLTTAFETWKLVCDVAVLWSATNSEERFTVNP